MKETIGLIGVGNMGSAILGGIFKKKIASPKQVWIYDKISVRSSSFAKIWKVHRATSIADLLARTDIVLLAVKPQDLTAMGDDVRANYRKTQILISILAGTPLAKIKRVFGLRSNVVRTMPNLGAKVGESVTALTGQGRHALQLADQIFSGCGKTVRVPEKYFNLVTAVSGSGPAYFFFLMELLINVAVKYGLPKKSAEFLTVQTALAAAKVAVESPLPPGALREMVTSKKGTTDAALKILYRHRFPKTFENAVRAALRRGRELSRR